jgi:hypothetical protein
MPGRTVTIVFIAAWISVAILYDVFAFWKWGAEASISRVIRDGSRWDPIIAFALGVLCGHFFWPQGR